MEISICKAIKASTLLGDGARCIAIENDLASWVPKRKASYEFFTTGFY
jgi:hypothetical protein